MKIMDTVAPQKTRAGWIFVFFMLVLLGCAEIQAAENTESVGSVMALRGSATAVNSRGDQRTLSLHSHLYSDDSITTGKAGRLRILFKDNSIVSLGGNSTAKIAEYAWNKETGESKMKIKISEGVFRIMGGLITRKTPGNFTVEAPAATIGIRGSMFAGRVSPQGLFVVFEGGKGITLTNGTGTGIITQMGHAFSIPRWDSPIPQPAITPLQTMNNLRQELAGTPSPPEHLALRQEFTSWAKDNPAQAPEVLKTAVANEQLNTENALGSVLQGMKNTDQKTFDKLINQAIDMGLTMEGTKRVVEEFKASDGVCN